MGKKKDKKKVRVRLEHEIKRELARLSVSVPKGSRPAPEMLAAATEAMRLIHRRLGFDGNDGTMGVMIVMKPREGPALMLANETHDHMMSDALGDDEMAAIRRRMHTTMH